MAPSQATHDIGDQQLAGSRLRTDAGRDVHRRANDALARIHRFAGMHADAHLDGMGSVIVCGSRLEDRQPGLDGLADGQEDDVERVTLGAYLGATDLADDPPYQDAIPSQQIAGRIVTVPLGKRRITAQVCKQEATGLASPTRRWIAVGHFPSGRWCGAKGRRLNWSLSRSAHVRSGATTVRISRQ